MNKDDRGRHLPAPHEQYVVVKASGGRADVIRSYQYATDQWAGAIMAEADGFSASHGPERLRNLLDELETLPQVFQEPGDAARALAELHEEHLQRGERKASNVVKLRNWVTNTH